MVDGTYQSRRVAHDIAALWETSFPVILGAATGVLSLWGAPIVVVAAKANDWHLDQLYVGTFGFLAITTGFLATFYGSIQTMSSGFIGRTRGTRALRRFLAYTKGAIIAGFIVSLASIPMMVVAPLPINSWSWQSLVVSAWLSAAVWAISGFYRVASHLFVLFDDSGEPPDELAN